MKKNRPLSHNTKISLLYISSLNAKKLLFFSQSKVGGQRRLS